jgi:hypothetical protein
MLSGQTHELFQTGEIAMGAATQRREDDLQKLRELVKEIDFCMLTTVDEGGDLHSRPMSSNGDIDADGDIWFFTNSSSHKVIEIAKLPKVNVSFADPDNQETRALTGFKNAVFVGRTVGAALRGRPWFEIVFAKFEAVVS